MTKRVTTQTQEWTFRRGFACAPVPGALPEAHQQSTEWGAGACEHNTLGSNAC